MEELGNAVHKAYPSKASQSKPNPLLKRTIRRDYRDPRKPPPPKTKQPTRPTMDNQSSQTPTAATVVYLPVAPGAPTPFHGDAHDDIKDWLQYYERMARQNGRSAEHCLQNIFLSGRNCEALDEKPRGFFDFLGGVQAKTEEDVCHPTPTRQGPRFPSHKNPRPK